MDHESAAIKGLLPFDPSDLP